MKKNQYLKKEIKYILKCLDDTYFEFFSHDQWKNSYQDNVDIV